MARRTKAETIQALSQRLKDIAMGAEVGFDEDGDVLCSTRALCRWMVATRDAFNVDTSEYSSDERRLMFAYWNIDEWENIKTLANCAYSYGVKP